MTPVDETAQRMVCGMCGYIYDPDAGDRKGKVPPGTAFADLPPAWRCPICGAKPGEFVPE